MATARGVEGMALVLHCAGPFSATAAQMMAACLAAHAHYLDITGEISVFEHARTLDAAARAAGIVICPGVGFDVIPTDCVAAALKAALPDATHLALGFQFPLGLLARNGEDLSRGPRRGRQGAPGRAYRIRAARLQGPAHRFRRRREARHDHSLGRRFHRLRDNRHSEHRGLHPRFAGDGRTGAARPPNSSGCSAWAWFRTS